MSSQASLATHARAGFWSRFGAIFIDGFLLGIPYWILIAVTENEGTALLISMLINAVYYSVLNGQGQTLGKRALGIRVVDPQTGDAIGIGRGFIRWLVSIASGVVVLLGYLWMLWDSEKQTWHDKAARSVVVSLT